MNFSIFAENKDGMTPTHHAKFWLRSYGKTQNHWEIRVRFTFNGKQANLPTNCQLDTNDAWNYSTLRVKSGYYGKNGSTTLSINSRLDKISDALDYAFMYIAVNEVEASMEQLLQKYYEKMGIVVTESDKPKPVFTSKTAKGKEFYTAYHEFMADCAEKNAWTESTKEKFSALEKDFRAYKKTIKFDDIDEKWLTGFVVYMRDAKKLHTPRKKQEDGVERTREDEYGVKNSTISKKLGYFKWFMNWATAKEYNAKKDYQLFKPTLKKAEKKVIYLTEQELVQLRDFEIPQSKQYLERVRDVFMFCCFTGLRHSDVFNLRRSDIKSDRIEFTTVKTADHLSFRMSVTARDILKKYEDIPFEDDKVLPVISNQTMNYYLKELCKLVGFDEEIRITTYSGNTRKDEIKHKWELIGTHTGRRTFIVNALSHGVYPNVLMKWTGHSDYKAMKPYIDIVESIQDSQMDKMDFLGR